MVLLYVLRWYHIVIHDDGFRSSDRCNRNAALLCLLLSDCSYDTHNTTILGNLAIENNHQHNSIFVDSTVENDGRYYSKQFNIFGDTYIKNSTKNN